MFVIVSGKATDTMFVHQEKAPPPMAVTGWEPREAGMERAPDFGPLVRVALPASSRV
jgi:hypothetical protein